MEITGLGSQIPLKAPEDREEPPPPREEPPPETEEFETPKAQEPGKGTKVDFTA